jgi:hypothetical protein
VGGSPGKSAFFKLNSDISDAAIKASMGNAIAPAGSPHRRFSLPARETGGCIA